MDLPWIVTVMAAAGAVAPAPPPVSLPAGVLAAMPFLAPARVTVAALTCAADTPPGRPLSFFPRVALAPGRVTARGYLRLTHCVSPDGSATALRSGWLSLKAVSTTSCTSVRDVRGRAVVTWFGADGRPIGTSKLRVKADHFATHRPADTLLTGAVATGPLADQPFHGDITPSGTLLGCLTRGMSTLDGAGRMTFG
ncbi:hypothetical protein [Nonomuraea sp. NPDC002799]